MNNYEKDLEKQCENLLSEVELLTKINEVLTLNVQVANDTINKIDELIDDRINEINKKWEDISPILGSDEYTYFPKETKIRYNVDCMMVEWLKGFKLDISSNFDISKEAFIKKQNEILERE
jgi:hypothetical protein